MAKPTANADSTKKTIVLTGATRGLGRALVLEFAQMGHRVLGCGRTESAVDRLREEFGPSHDFSTVDVADFESVSAWAARLLSECGLPDLLINNAAVINRNAPLWEVEPADFHHLMDINVKGVFHVIRSFVPAMVASKRGTIVNLSSYWGRSVSAEVAPYCASKWAIEGLTRALALELPSGLATVAFNPGVIATDMLRSTFGESASSYIDPALWAKTSAPFLLSLGPQHNGQSLTAPGQ